MFIYNGKFNWFNFAVNETITIVFPAGFALNDPVSAYWQWSVEDNDKKKSSVATCGVVQRITTTLDSSSALYIPVGFYSFAANVTADFKTLIVTMHDTLKGEDSGPFNLNATHINTTSIPSTVVYTGRLGWSSYAKDEMTTLVVPYGVAEGAFFGLYHQWTVDAAGVEKANVPIVKIGTDGSITAKFSAAYYTYNFTFSGKRGSFVLSNPKGDKSVGNKFVATYNL